MNRKLAARIIQIAIEFDPHIEALSDISYEIGDQEMKKSFKGCSDEIMGLINRDIIAPILRMYPDLDPDK